MTPRAGKKKPHGPLSPEQVKAATEFLNDLDDMLNGHGKHADHQQQQVGRCVYCSCGLRLQGRLPNRTAQEPRPEP